MLQIMYNLIFHDNETTVQSDISEYIEVQKLNLGKHKWPKLRYLWVPHIYFEYFGYISIVFET